MQFESTALSSILERSTAQRYTKLKFTAQFCYYRGPSTHF